MAATYVRLTASAAVNAERFAPYQAGFKFIQTVCTIELYFMKNKRTAV